MHHDRLTSITAITDGSGAIIEERGFDAFGAPLDAQWRSNSGLLNGTFSDRGFTSHKHMDEHKVIHMDGRLYDPLLGRFFSVDPLIYDTKNTQSQNAYTYVMNNPLSMIDPTGYAPDRVAEEEQLGEKGAPPSAKSEKDNGKKGISGVIDLYRKALVRAKTETGDNPESALSGVKDQKLLTPAVKQLILAHMAIQKQSKAEIEIDAAKDAESQVKILVKAHKPAGTGDNLTSEAANILTKATETHTRSFAG